MDSVKCLDVEFQGDGECAFPALEELRISEMPNLDEWKIGNSVESFPRLKDLDIWWCPKLSNLPFLPSLRSLIIFESSTTLLDLFNCLTFTYISICSGLQNCLFFQEASYRISRICRSVHQ
ncbi:UNVERIFIED_CONTAM: hypothetical protein Sradi_0761800 [Sesamum radiatum]|uniref:Uncharacterized protein n=1 Tax=Sesamum radiatum TaxID=300843 RepID=A0AAW2VQ56_SESRA